MDLGLHEHTALITGADSGIGLACAQTLLAEGASVVIADQYPDQLAATAAQLDHPRLHHFPVDVTSNESIEELTGYISTLDTPYADILINAAGIHGPDSAFHEIDDDGWRETFEVNLFGSVRMTRAVLPWMRERGWGRVVFISSEDGVQPYASEVPYSASKAALLNLAKGISRTYAKEGILINSVSPAFISTPMTDEMMTKRAEQRGTDIREAIQSFLAEERPSMETNRRGKPEEVAAVIAFLCSEQASFVNGANYRVDAGSVWTI